MRIRRRGKTEAFSLFAFQDIIISVMGIVVLITLILALELVDSKSDSQTSKTEAQTDKTAKTAEELQEEIDKMRAALAKTFEDSDTIVTSNVSVLNEMVNKAEEDRDNWENELDQNSETLGNAKERKEDSEQYANDTKDGIEEEIERLKKENEELARKVKKLESGGRRLFRKGNENQTTWLVEITTKGFACARIGESEKPRVHGSAKAFYRWLQSLDPNTENVYACVKPDGTALFRDAYERYVETKLRVGFGYRCVGLLEKILDDETGAGI